MFLPRNFLGPIRNSLVAATFPAPTLQPVFSYRKTSVGKSSLASVLFGVGIMVLLELLASAQGQSSVTVMWSPSPGSDIAAYNVYYGTASHNYTGIVSVGQTVKATITGLRPGTTYFFALTAVNSAGLESAFSNEMSYTVPIPLPKLEILLTTSRQVLLSGTAQSGHIYDILATQDFVVWRAIGTVTADTNGLLTFTDPGAAGQPSRFYRLHDTTYTIPGTLPMLRVLAAANAQVLLTGTGQMGHSYDILATEDFVLWKFIGSMVAGTDGSFTATDPGASGQPRRFYRLHETTYSLPGSLPTLQTSTAANGQVTLTVTGQIGHTYNILATQNFALWTLIDTATVGANGSFEFVDPASAGSSSHFYRVQESQ